VVVDRSCHRVLRNGVAAVLSLASCGEPTGCVVVECVAVREMFVVRCESM